MAVTVTVMEVGECEEHLAAIVRERLGTKLRVLDAGCGRMWNWDLGDVDMHLTGIDEDAEALRLRVEVKKDLDEAIVGDLRTVPLDDEAYDLVHSAYVLEHVSGAELVLDRMLAALRPGGLMVIKVPDGDSVYGWITRMTPHWVHVKYKRWIRRKKLAGTPGHGPYPVVYDDVICRRGITEWGERHGLELVDLSGENSHIEFFGPFKRVADLGLRAVAALSFGRLTARYSNLDVIFQKPTV
ncbi:MAG: class I SAM-dependent methyltransferase [Acidimicrobiales bacterium]